MDFATLEVFRAVAKVQSINRAADLLGQDPATVTTRIKEIEMEIGKPLFERDERQMALTIEGASYLDYAERILNLADEARQVVNPAGPSGVLRVGSMEAAAAARLPIPLATFNARWPQVTINLSTAPTRELIDGLLAHRIDCALIAIPSDEWWVSPGKLDTVALFSEELVIVLPPGHPEVEHSSEIKPSSLAAFETGCTYRMLTEEWLTHFGTRKANLRIQEVSSYHAMIACTASGTCFCAMPRTVLDLIPDASHFTIRPIATIDTYLATRPGFMTPAFSEFRDALMAFSDIKAARNVPT